MSYNIIIFSSVTYALKAQGIFEREGIKSRLEKLRKEKSLHGCGYGLKVKNFDVIRAKLVSERERIKIIDILDYN